MTREEAMKKFMASKRKKTESLEALKQRVKQAYEAQTGLKANYVSVL